MKNIPAKVIFNQLKRDLIGKDAFRGITLSYAWLANQFGHFALGFIPTTLLYMWNSGTAIGNRGIYWPSFVVWGFWLGFEFMNFVVSVLKLKRNLYQKNWPKKLFYKSRRWQFIFDTFTDLCFFGLGITCATLIFSPSIIIKIIAVMLVCILIPSSYYWYGAKIYVQRAVYPFQFRLSRWTRKMGYNNEEAVNRFMNAEFSASHLLIMGDNTRGKTNLCVGIGTELSNLHKKCCYLTAMKAFEGFYREAANEGRASGKFIWNWQEASLLIIDDINPSHSEINDILTPDEFLENIEKKFGDRNKQILRAKKVIWVLGNETPDKTEETNWKAMLVKVGVETANIITVNLSVTE